MIHPGTWLAKVRRFLQHFDKGLLVVRRYGEDVDLGNDGSLVVPADVRR
jgi:hypothetical protein